MGRGERLNRGILSLLKKRTSEMKKRTIVVGLKSDHFSREMLLCLLNRVVVTGDNVLAIHVQEENDTFDPNMFHIQEDLCKYKKVDFQVKICNGSCYISELSHQVRVNFGTILALGCSSGPRGSTISKCLKALPPTCTLMVMDIGGHIIFQKQGTSQQGGTSNKALQSCQSALSTHTTSDMFEIPRQMQKSLTMPSPSSTSLTPIKFTNPDVDKTTLPQPNVDLKVSERLSALEASGKHFSVKELKKATNDFGPDHIIGNGGQSMVYRANLENGKSVAVKVFCSTESSGNDVLQEVEILSGLEHENIVRLVGYCYTKEIHAVVYDLHNESLKQCLKELRWNERVRVAIGVAKALHYLHTCSPSIIHRDVKSSNILLTDDRQPLLSDFGLAVVHQNYKKVPTDVSPNLVVGTFGYMAPEYMMYGKVDEKIDVYSYGVVLLELITGRGAIQTSKHSSKHESLVLWARSILCSGLCDRLIDPKLRDDYDKEEMKMMMGAARLCLLHSSSKRPSMKTILRLFEEPEYWLGMQRKREELLSGIPCLSKTGSCKHQHSGSNESFGSFKHQHSGSNESFGSFKHQHSGSNESFGSFKHQHSGSNETFGSFKHQHSGSNETFDLGEKDLQ